MASSDKCSGGICGMWLDNNLYHALKMRWGEEEEEEEKEKKERITITT